jgi:hypothetical protein
VIVVNGWEDIVKVADMLGRPILRVVPPGKPHASGPVSFYVLMGTIAYRFSPDGLPREPSATVRGAMSSTARRTSRRSARRSNPGEVAAVPGRGFPSLLDVVAWTGRISQIVKAMPPSVYRDQALERILQVIELAKSGELLAAWIALGQLNAMLGGSPAAE